MRTITAIALLAIAISSPAMAQAYKCVINGKTVYADAPCAPNAKQVGALEDRLTEDQQIQRLQQSIKERRARNRIEGQQNAEFEAQQNAIARQAAREEAQAQANEAARQRRCASLQREMTHNKRGMAIYQDVGMQRSLTVEEQELKRNREEFDRNCR